MEADPKVLIGKKIGRYELHEVLGEGGMAAVYRAFDIRLEREVALKLFRRDAFSPAVARRMLKRFDREAKALARLSHPNIVVVLDYGSFEDSLFLVMKYLPGGTLKDKAGSPIPFQEAARLLIPIARALDYAHREGIIHRDVKPANILLTKTGEPMLSDFGIAKIVEDNKSISLTATNSGVGTPEYMAPEQWVNKVSNRSDIYSLGIIFYELVTGAKPYAADTPAGVAIKQATEPLTDPRHYTLDLPEEVVRVVVKALARKLEDRFESMGQFAEALERLSVIPLKDNGSTAEMRSREASSILPTIPLAEREEKPLTQVLPKEEKSPKPRRKTGHMAWVVVHILLSLVLGLLMVGVALITVEGVIVMPTPVVLPGTTVVQTPMPTTAAVLHTATPNK